MNNKPISSARRIVACGNRLGEGPVWDVVEQAIWWVDIEERKLQRYQPGTAALQEWILPERVSACAPRKHGGMVLALASGFAFFDPATGAIERLAAPEQHLPGNRFNDGKCDRRGRFWAGTMTEASSDSAPENALESTGALHRLDADLTCHRMEGGIGISNSLAWSPDDRVLYFTDTREGSIRAYDFDIDTGSIANRRVFAAAGQRGFPDGSTVDAEGFLWNARWDGWCLVRHAPDGRVDRVVELPVQRPTSCCFGGPDLRTLYVTSAIGDLSADALAAQPEAGNLLALDIGVCGLPETRFAG